MAEARLPRGIRNHNPGNIRLSATKWQGQKAFQLDPDFVEFEEPAMGLRALMRLLLTYYHKYGLNTVESLINRYAPPHENATDGYIGHVAKLLGVKRRQVLDLAQRPVLIALAAAITRHENGPPPGRAAGWYPPETFEKAATLLMKG